MKKSRCTEEQIVLALRQSKAGTPNVEVCRKMGISERTFFRWKPGNQVRGAELAEERERLERRSESSTRASLAAGRIGSLAKEAHESVWSLGAILRSGSIEDRAATIRRCVERGVVEFDERRVKVFVRALPVSAEGQRHRGGDPRGTLKPRDEGSISLQSRSRSAREAIPLTSNNAGSAGDIHFSFSTNNDPNRIG